MWINFTIEATRVHSKTTRFNKIAREYHRSVYRQALRNLYDRKLAEEVTQDVFLSIYRDLHNFRAESHLGTWIYRITANRCFYERRKKNLESISLEEAESNQQLIDEDVNPERQYIKHEADTRLDKLISMLPGKEAEVITLCYFEDKSCKEIARILRIPRGRVAVTLYRGRVHLHALLTRQDNEETTNEL